MPTHGYAARRSHPAALALILGGHAAVIAALVLIKMEIVRDPTVATRIYDVPTKPPPPIDPPPPPPPAPRAEPRPPRADTRITAVPPLVPTPSPGPTVDPSPRDQVVIPLAPDGPTNVAVGPVDPPTPPARPKEEPLPKAKPIGVKPRGDPGGWVTNDDYPDAALRGEEQGRTAFRLDVAADGRPAACAVTASSGSRVLDAAACKLLMRRARFAPGRDADGRAVGGTYANSFNWKIPED